MPVNLFECPQTAYDLTIWDFFFSFGFFLEKQSLWVGQIPTEGMSHLCEDVWNVASLLSSVRHHTFICFLIYEMGIIRLCLPHKVNCKDQICSFGEFSKNTQVRSIITNPFQY